LHEILFNKSWDLKVENAEFLNVMADGMPTYIFTKLFEVLKYTINRKIDCYNKNIFICKGRFFMNLSTGVMRDLYILVGKPNGKKPFIQKT
jgi:hypothetical protein